MISGSATYSPEDNKIRLYPDERIDSDLYQRVKGAGYKWAPRQQLFVAPMWTPAREDLAVELFGEVQDEDQTLVDRAEERADRFGGYAENRERDATQAKKGVDLIAENIPFGQPILVGHHSEKRARRDADKIHNGMMNAIRMWDQSKYWQQRAQGAIRAAKYKERPDVRARRIKKLESGLRKCEKNKKEAQRWIKLWSNIPESLKKKDGTLPTMRDAAIFLANYSHIRITKGLDGTGDFSAWDVLRPDGERYQNCPAWTPEQVKEKVIPSYERGIKYNERWIAHYNNRLTYERAMLQESGGTVADRTKPEKGGAVKCWVRPGWCEIAKVNKVTVSVWDNWGNGGRDFLRNVRITDLKAIMSKADYEKYKNGDDPDPSPPPAPKPEPQRDEKSEQTALSFENLREAVKNKTAVVTVSADQLFPTPKEVAQQVIELAQIEKDHTVLEPSAGTGNLLAEIPDGVKKTAVELNLKLAQHLDRRKLAGEIINADFLGCNGLGTFDRIVMNPPFKNAVDIQHIEKALTYLKSPGRLVAICANGPRQREKLMCKAEQWINLPDGSFKESGTNVHAAIVVINKPLYYREGRE